MSWYLVEDEELKRMYPQLYACGVRSEDLKQVSRAWALKKLDLEDLHDALEKAEWDVRENPAASASREHVLGLLLSGFYPMPVGFRFQRELQAEERMRAMKRLEELREQTQYVQFEHWWNNQLDDEGRRKVDTEISSQLGALRYQYFKKKVLKWMDVNR